jgi:hypothetical protein
LCFFAIAALFEETRAQGRSWFQPYIEILGATLEEASMKKGEFFTADLYPIL